MTSEKVFEIINLSFAYEGKQIALDNINLTVQAGEALAILGANGCGKSTLLKLLDGLYFPEEGNLPRGLDGNLWLEFLGLVIEKSKI